MYRLNTNIAGHCVTETTTANSQRSPAVSPSRSGFSAVHATPTTRYGTRRMAAVPIHSAIVISNLRTLWMVGTSSDSRTKSRFRVDLDQSSTPVASRRDAHPPQAVAGGRPDDAHREPELALRVGVPVQFLGLRLHPRDRNCLLPAVFQQAFRAAVPRPDAGVLPAGHRGRQGVAVDERVVDVDGADFKWTRDALGTLVVAGPHRGGEPVLGVVRQPDRLGLVGH